MSDATYQGGIHPVDEILPAPKLFTLGFQHVLVMAASPITAVFLVAQTLGFDPALTVSIISATFLVCGIGSILQSYGPGGFGARLPFIMVPGGAPIAIFLAGIVAVIEHSALSWAVLVAGFFLAWMGAERSRGRRGVPQQPALSLALGVLYIGIAGLCLIELRHDNEAGRDNILFLLFTVWASDIGAYMAGRVVGGPKLWPQVSPNKTWSGAIGGLVFAMLVGALLTLVLAPGSMARAAAVAAILAVATQAGDLLESAIKRHFKVKDTSSLIPGHGGLLDRLDGLLAAAPVAALLALVLDGVDGWVARRTRMATAYGKQLDINFDTVLMGILAVLAWQDGKAGAWVLAIGLARYGFVAAGWVWPMLNAELPFSQRRRVICVVQIAVLLACILPVIQPPLSSLAAAAALGLLLFSFAVDTLWLVKAGADDGTRIDGYRDRDPAAGPARTES